ncbi:DUF6612 family protein [Saccharibacillus sp. JS10]|uniref:DUF6612 family protein n=1 Tax=Saccharibacillus sp. JS10 TaxID=2950552 RepID=UPI00210E27A0|nr:DUF6612 family protein [Saccharibacillus sp. JS10]MCQ4085659.1 hypothetical protein [Saccharibacillus sp. JS10]
MKKLWMTLCSAALVVSITACGNNNETATETPAATGTTAPAETATETPATEATETTTPEEPAAAEASSMSAEELLNKAEAATKDLKSYNMVADVDQSMTLNGEENTSKTTMNTDIVLDPISAYQEIKAQASGTDTDIKQYITADAIYMEVGGQWTKLPEEQRSQVMSTLESASNLENSFDQFKSVAKEITVTEEGDDYVLNASLSGDQIKSMAAEMLGSTTDEQSAAALDQMNIEEMKLTYAINKETSFPTKSLVDMTMSMESGEGEQKTSMEMHMIMDSTISKHNEIKDIEVPKDVVDSAK